MYGSGVKSIKVYQGSMIPSLTPPGGLLLVSRKIGQYIGLETIMQKDTETRRRSHRTKYQRLVPSVLL
jgi:hypothetical protein